MAGRMFVMYVWMIENMHSKEAAGVTSRLFFINSLTIFWASLYFKYINKDWRYVFGLPCFGVIIFAIIFIFQNESPKFYYGHGRYDEVRRVLTDIGRRNKMLGPNETYNKKFAKEVKASDVTFNNDDQIKLGINYFLKDKLNLKNQCIFIVNSMACSFCFYLINFYIKYLPGDIYTN
jgi:hypothetical protein